MLLEVEGVTKRFGGIVAVDDISFEVDRGPITGVIGPNGAGKTTLFNLISGFYKPTRGTIQFNGEPIQGLSMSEIANLGVGRTFQIARPFGQMTVHENLIVSNYDLPREERESRVKEVLNVVELSHQAETLAKNLSGGQQTLLELGRVLMLEPELVLLDEPAAGVNPKLVDRIATLIEKTHDERTYMIVEHDITLVSRLCDRVIVLNEGAIIADGHISEIQENEVVRKAYLGE